MLAALLSLHYGFSTSGAIFGHPDDEAMAQVIARATPEKKTLHFSYTAATIAKHYKNAKNCKKKKKKKKRDRPKWNDTTLMKKYGYVAHFPANDTAGIVLDL